MELNQIFDNLTDWSQKNICNGMKLLKPSASEMTSEYELVTPKAFALYLPPKDQLPPDVQEQIPSVCLQLQEGADDMQANSRSLRFRLAFSTYRPGRYIEEEDEEGRPRMVFTRDAKGWEDLWLWVSRSVNKIQTEMYIEGLRIDRTVPIKYGPFQIDDTLIDAYPLWYAWIDFTIKCGISLKDNNYKVYL